MTVLHAKFIFQIKRFSGQSQTHRTVPSHEGRIALSMWASSSVVSMCLRRLSAWLVSLCRNTDCPLHNLWYLSFFYCDLCEIIFPILPLEKHSRALCIIRYQQLAHSSADGAFEIQDTFFVSARHKWPNTCWSEILRAAKHVATTHCKRAENHLCEAPQVPHYRQSLSNTQLKHTWRKWWLWLITHRLQPPDGDGRRSSAVPSRPQG